MELTESIESINKQLVDLFGIDTITGQSMFRIVWSEDQFEKRLTDCTDKGIVLPYPEVRLLPKYRQWVQEKYVLERLVLIPEINKDDLPTSKLSYEPLWVFMDENGFPLPPTLWAAKFCVDAVYAALGKKSMAKYIDEEAKNPIEYREARVNKLQSELFGNETSVGDALAYKSGVGYTGIIKEN